MIDEKIKELEAKIAETKAEIETATSDLKAMLEDSANADLNEAKEMRASIDVKKETLNTLTEELNLFKEVKNEPQTAETHAVATETKTMREAVGEYIRTKGAVVDSQLKTDGKDVLVPMNVAVNPTADGLKKEGTEKVTSKEIVTTPIREVKTVLDLKQFATIHKASKGEGSYPILKRATSEMVSVEELEKNPALAKPEFTSVDWKVKTYRGAIPLSQEAIDDADVDLLAIVAEAANQIKVNTTNKAIATVLKDFEAKNATNLDEIKHILNKDLDPAYNVSFVVSQSFYQKLDTLKDKNDRYLLQDSITSASGKEFLGHPVFVVSDTTLGAEGEAHAFIGDIQRGVLFADRQELGLRWADNDIYGQYLQAVVRFDVKKADAKAGYFVTMP
ncbi:phage major capsid protein [Streptococcus sp. S2(2023)]|uniref:Phage major capsid protein n=1 Tax=Streptococcus gingivalis TaxID=3111861 RepID=A0ABU6BBE8_9STRE|nr:phage major capsid protein [Streptococcus sp. S2(2023)]MEB3521042.1 phage major capsid protein [Streptococcus sp. S2(2023)]